MPSRGSARGTCRRTWSDWRHLIRMDRGAGGLYNWGSIAHYATASVAVFFLVLLLRMFVRFGDSERAESSVTRSRRIAGHWRRHRRRQLLARRAGCRIASGLDFPTRLAGGLAAANAGGPLLLVEPGAIPPAVATDLDPADPGGIVVARRPPSSQRCGSYDGVRSYTTGTVTSGRRRPLRDRRRSGCVARFPLAARSTLATEPQLPDAPRRDRSSNVAARRDPAHRPNSLPASAAAALAALNAGEASQIFNGWPPPRSLPGWLLLAACSSTP